jgi:Periplasmic binding protein-like domain
MHGAGLELRPELTRVGDYTGRSGEQIIAALLESGHRLTAVCCANDQMAFGARLALYRRGLWVPEDVSLTGFDDLFAARYTTPPLGTVRQAVQDLGVQAAEAPSCGCLAVRRCSSRCTCRNLWCANRPVRRPRADGRASRPLQTGAAALAVRGPPANLA